MRTRKVTVVLASLLAIGGFLLAAAPATAQYEEPPEVGGEVETPEPTAAPEPVATPAPLAFTGSNTKPMVQIALAVIAAGGLLLFFGRRSRDEEPAEVNV